MGRLDLLVNNAGLFGPAGGVDEIKLADWQRVVDVNLTGAFLCAREAFRADEGAGPARRPHHQQRIDLGACAATELGAVHRDQARDHRADEVDRAGRPQVRHRLRADRYRQRRDRNDGAHERRHPAAERLERSPSPRSTSRTWPEPSLYMASLPLDANVLFMTVMATKMPYVGRG